jgi:hypothetical protein
MCVWLTGIAQCAQVCKRTVGIGVSNSNAALGWLLMYLGPNTCYALGACTVVLLLH